MNPDKPTYILWLPSWYPNKLEPYDGDFIQRHALAVSAFIPVHVVHFVRDKGKIITNSVFVEEKKTGNLTETIVYYSNQISSRGIIERIFSVGKFRSLYRKIIHDLFLKKGLPSLVHVHIAFKAGLVARWIRKKYAIQFFLSEHWTIYLAEARPNFKDLNYFKRYLISKIVKDASKVFPVSNYLGQAIRKRWPDVSYEVVPNVVDIKVFYPGERSVDETCHFIHISNLNYQKDPEKLFRAIKLLKAAGFKFFLDVFGTRNESIKSQINGYGIEDVVTFHQEVPQRILVEHLRNSDALILYSRYETFGCVIIEANACGIPVIVADIPVMHELVRQNENGVLVSPGSAEALADAVINVFNDRKFSKQNIVRSAKLYSYAEVGKLIFDEYLSPGTSNSG